MSHIANAFLVIARIIAEISGSGLEIEIRDTSINYRFKRKKDTEKRVWENHYSNAAIYIADAAEPVNIDANPQEYDVKTSDYLATFMEQTFIQRAFNAKGELTKELKMLLYVTIVAVVGMGLLQIVVISQ